MIIKIYDSLYTMVKPIQSKNIYNVEKLTDKKRSELVDKFNAMEKRLFFKIPPVGFFPKNQTIKRDSKRRYSLKEPDNDTKYLAIAEYTQDGKVIDAGGAVLQHADHLGFGINKEQWWLNEVCRSYHHIKKNKQTPSPIPVVIEELYNIVCALKGKELYLMIEINPINGNPQILVEIYRKYGFTLVMAGDKPATINETYYYMKRECPQKGGRRKKRTRRRRRKNTQKKKN